MEIPKDTQLFEHAMATFWFDKDGILHSVSKSGNRTIEGMKDYIAFVKKMVDNKKICILSDITNANPMDKETREYSATQLEHVYKAMALLSESEMGKIIGKVFIQLETQPYPIRMFANEQDAREWLKQYL